MSTIEKISDSKCAAVEAALEELHALEGFLPVATPDDLEGAATALVVAATQLRVCAREVRARGNGGVLRNLKFQR